MILLLLFAAVALIVLYLVVVRYRTLKLRSDLGLDGPPSSLFLGSFPALQKDRESFGEYGTVYDVLGLYRKRYGTNFAYFAGGRRMEIISFDLDLLKEVFIKKFGLFVDRPIMPASDNQDVMNNMVVTLSGDNGWKDVRSFLSPSFTANKLKQMSHAMAEKTNVMISELDKQAETGKPFDIQKSFQGLTLDVIAKVAFGADTNCQTDPDDMFLKSCQDFFQGLDITKQPLVMGSLLVPEFEMVWSKLRTMAGFNKAEAWLLRLLNNIIKKRSANLESFEGVDILQLLLLQNRVSHGAEVDAAGFKSKKNLYIDETSLLANSFAFLLAGYETTSTALSYTAWCLANHPEVQGKLQDEIDEKVKSESDINYSLVHDMPYLDAVFKESLRLYPPVPMFVSRCCVEDCEILGQRFAKGVQILAPVYNIHHDPEIYEEPEKYIPERFLEGREYHAMAWIPFGAGPRNCIGLRFAEMEYKLALVKTLMNFTLVLPEDAPKKLRVDSLSPVMRPKDGIIVKVERRNK